MLRIKSDMGMVAMQRYINKKAVKGYRLKSIVPFILFPPLHFIAFTFKKSATNKIRYLVEYQRFEDDDLKKKYIQHMKIKDGHYLQMFLLIMMHLFFIQIKTH